MDLSPSPPGATRTQDLLELLRPRQWLKNGFLLLPAFFAHALAPGPVLLPLGLALLAFCLAASAVYVLNDVLDAEVDRQHPAKAGRPVASGRISPRAALVLAALLAAAALALSLWVPGLATPLVAYLVLNLVYCLGAKHLALVDVMLIASGMLIRLWAGGAVAQVELSPWILVMGFLLALFLALGKRYKDLALGDQASLSRPAMAGYSREFLIAALAGLSGAVIVCYLLYTLAPETLARHGAPDLYLSALWVVLGVLRYLSRVLSAGGGGNPARELTSDPVLLLAVAGWFATLSWVFHG